MSRQSSEREDILRVATRIGQYRVPCPICGPERKKMNQKQPTMNINRDDQRVVYNCHHCGVNGAVRVGERMNHNVVALEPEKPVERKDPALAPKLDQERYDWLLTRGISPATADKYGVFAKSEHFFPAAQKKENGLCFPYYDKGGQIISAKIRSVESKAFTCWQPPMSFFGIEHVKEGEDFVIVEGEMDALAFAEIGVNAVSVPNGAPMKVQDGKIAPEEDKKFRFLWAAETLINKAKRIIIAVDKDGPGEALAEELARRVGRDRCWLVHWPEGCKDANDVLMSHGPTALKECYQKASAWPVAGLYDAIHFEQQVYDLYEKGMGRGESTGYENVDELYTITPGQLTVVTGIPSSGKSEFIDQIMVNMAENKQWKFGICSFENEPRLHIAKLMSKRVHKPFFQGYRDRINADQFKAAYSWINDHFVFLHQENGDLSDLDSILDRLKVAVLRHGIRGAIIDPYNFINRPREFSETEWISAMLTKIKAFVMAHDIHIWFVAHPTKLQKGADGKIPPPGGYDISGSAAWFAKADCGLTVHRDMAVNPLEAQIHIWKCRFSWVGKQGQTRLYYDVGTTRYADYGGNPPQIENQDQDIFH